MAVKAVAQATWTRPGAGNAVEYVAGVAVELRLADGTVLTPYQPGTIDPATGIGTPISTYVTDEQGWNPPADVWVASDVARVYTGDRAKPRTLTVSRHPADVVSPAELDAAVSARTTPIAQDVASLTQTVADKADQSALTTGLQGKVNTSTYTSAVTSINTSLAGKVDQSAFDALQAAVDAAAEGPVEPSRIVAADAPAGTVLSRTADGVAWTTPPAGTGEGVSDASVAAVVPSGATAQAIASLVGVVVRGTDAEATTAAGQYGVLGLVVDEVVGSGGGTDPEPPTDTTAPVITAPSWPSLTVGSAIDPVTLSADEPVTWAISAGALPAGMTLHAGSGTVSGTPTAAGSGSVTFTGTDAAGNAASVVWSWTVAAAPVEWAPVMSEAFSSLNESAADLTGRVADNALGGTLEVTPTIGTYTGANSLLALRTSTTGGTYATGQPFGVGLSPEVVGGVGTDALLTWAGFEAGDRALDFKATSGYNAGTQRMDAGYRVYLYYNPVTRARIGAMVYQAGVMLEVTNGSTQANATTTAYSKNQTIELRGIVAGGDLTVTLTVRKTDGTVNGTPVSLTTPAAGLMDAPAVAVHYPDSANMGYGSLDDLVVYRNVSTAPTVRSVLFSERYSNADETEQELLARSPDNYAGGTVTTPPTVGAFAQAAAGTLATGTTGGTVGALAVGAGLRLGAQLAEGADVALRYALPAEPRHAEFTVTSAPAVTNVVVMLHEAGTGTYAWVQANTGNITASARSSYGTTQTSTSIPFSQGDRIRVESVLVGADTQVTATNLTTGSSTVATLAGANVTARASMAVQYPVRFGKGSIDDLIVYSGGAA